MNGYVVIERYYIGDAGENLKEMEKDINIKIAKGFAPISFTSKPNIGIDGTCGEYIIVVYQRR